MWNRERPPVSEELDRLEVLLGEQDRLMILATQSILGVNESDPKAQIARFRLEVSHRIAVELREKINCLREDFLLAKLQAGVKSTKIN